MVVLEVRQSIGFEPTHPRQDESIHIHEMYRRANHLRTISHALTHFSIFSLFKTHLSWSFYFLYVLGIVNSRIIKYILVSTSSELLNKTDI